MLSHPCSSAGTIGAGTTKELCTWFTAAQQCVCLLSPDLQCHSLHGSRCFIQDIHDRDTSSASHGSKADNLHESTYFIPDMHGRNTLPASFWSMAEDPYGDMGVNGQRQTSSFGGSHLMTACKLPLRLPTGWSGAFQWIFAQVIRQGHSTMLLVSTLRWSFTFEEVSICTA